MQTSDKNILRLIDLLIFQKRIFYAKDFCNEIDMLEQTLSKIKKGQCHFTVAQIEMICKSYNVNANWIFGIEENVFNKPKALTKSKNFDFSMSATSNF